MKRRVGLLIALAVLVIVAGAIFVLVRGDRAKLPLTATEGPSPTLPDPTKRLIPTVHIAPAKGWTDGAKPVAAPGLEVSAFATVCSIRAGFTSCPMAACWLRNPTDPRGRRTARE